MGLVDWLLGKTEIESPPARVEEHRGNTAILERRLQKAVKDTEQACKENSEARQDLSQVMMKNGSSPESLIQHLLQSRPGMSDDEISREASVPIEEVRRIRGELKEA